MPLSTIPAIGGPIAFGTAGSVLFVNPAGLFAQLAVGTNGHVLTLSGGLPTWAAPTGGSGMAIGGAVTGGTDGSVLFVGTGGVLGQDNTNFFYDDANNRLTIASITAPHGTNSERFGLNASASGLNSLAVGNGATASGSSSMAVGRASTAGAGGAALGVSTSAGSDALAIGTSSVAPNGSLAIGPSAVLSSGNTMLFGGANSNWGSVIFGKGETSASPDSVILQPTDSSGSDVAGANVSLAAGRATGSALGGAIVFRTSDAGSTGTTLQTLRERARFDRDGNLTYSRQSSTTTRETARVDVTMPVTTDASRTGRYSVSVTDFSATREAIRLDATGSAATVTIPSLTQNSVMVVGTGGLVTEVLAGTNGHVLTMVTGAPAWAAAAGGGMAIGGSITSATEGSVLFAGPLGVLAEDNTNFQYVDADNSLVLAAAPPASATKSLLRLGSAIASGDADGTYLGINAGSGYAGDFEHYQVDGTSKAKIDNLGALRLRMDDTTGKILLGGVTGTTGYGGMWIGAAAAAPSFSNFTFLGVNDGGSGPEAFFNAPGSLSSMWFRVNNDNRMRITNATIILDGVPGNSGISATNTWVTVRTSTNSVVPLALSGVASQAAQMLVFHQVSSTAVERAVGGIDTPWLSSTDGSRTTEMVFTCVDHAATREFLRGRANGSAAAIGFLGATPVVRATSTTDLRQALIDYGLYTTGGASPLDLNGGALTAGSITLSGDPTAGATVAEILMGSAPAFGDTGGHGIAMNYSSSFAGEFIHLEKDSQLVLELEDSGITRHYYRDAATNDVATTFEVRRTTSGTAAAGFGVRERVTLDSSVQSRSAYDAITTWVDATDATRASRTTYNAYYTSNVRECLRIEANSTAAMIGFLGASAVARTAAYTVTNLTTDRTLNCNSTTLDEIADVLGTLIEDLRLFGLLG